MPISSPHNQKLKQIRKLRQRRRAREREGLFVAESEDVLAAADAAGWEPLERYCAAGSGLPGVEVDGELLAQASGLASGTRALAVYRERWANRPSGPLCLYLHGLHDPGNLGTIIRGAAAFSAGSVALGPGCADPYSPKAVRASMGAIFQIALLPDAEPQMLPGATVALDPRADRPLGALEIPGEVSLLIGSEREGLPEEIMAGAHHRARIPVAIDSLNAAMAATVALYELRNRMTAA